MEIKIAIEKKLLSKTVQGVNEKASSIMLHYSFMFMQDK